MGFPPSGANAEPPAALLLEGILCKEVNKVSCKYWVMTIGRARRVLVMRSISQAFALCSLLATASFLPGQVATAAVCIDYLDGTRCHSYPEPTPSAPGTTQGMRKSPSNQVVKIGGLAQITAGPFKPYEEISVFVFGMFPQRYAQRLMYTVNAGSNGYVTAGYRPSREPESYTYKNPWLCVRGEATGRLACVPFYVGSGASKTAPRPKPVDRSEPYPSPAPRPKPSPAPNSSGFSVPIPF